MTRPNFLVVVADQLRADAVGAFGSDIAATPVIDELAARGTTFTNAFVQHSVCSPSRASFLTGWYPHVRGHRSLTHLLRPDDPNLLKTLKQNGYHVTHAGMRGDTWAPGGTEASCHEYGWIEPPTVNVFAAMADADRNDPMVRAFYTGRSDDDGADFDEATIRTAEAWLAARPTDRPWMLYVPLMFPHCPFGVGDPWFSLHDRNAIPARRPPVRSGHEPAYMQHLRDTYGTGRLGDDDWREIAAVYHGMVSRLDWHVGRLLDALGDERDDTVVVFFSDHGEYLGDYDLIEKWPSGLHDCLTRTPLVIAGPQIGAGVEFDGMVELIDLVPTVHELAGVVPDYTHFGRSLLPALAGAVGEHREFAFSEGGFLVEEAHLFETPGFPYDLKGQAEHERPDTVGKAVSVRSKDWTFVWRLYEPAELYDRTADPAELHNLAGRPEHASIESTLRDAVMRWLVATADVMPWQPDPRFPCIDLPAPPSAGGDLGADLAEQPDAVGEVAVGGQVHRQTVDAGVHAGLELLAHGVGIAEHEELLGHGDDLVVPALGLGDGPEVGLGRFHGGSDHHHHQLGDDDLGTVTSEPIAVLGEHLQLAGDLGDRSPRQVRLVGVLGDHPERLLLAGAADHDRDPRQGSGRVDGVVHLVVRAGERHALAPQQRDDDLERFFELLEAISERAELEPERVVLELEPAGADAERGPTARHVVECRDRLGQQAGVAIGVAGHQGRQPNGRRVLGECGEHRVALEHRLVGGSEHRQLIEVVHHEHAIEAGRLGRLGLVDNRAEQLGRGDAGIGEVGDLVAEPGHRALLASF